MAISIFLILIHISLIYLSNFNSLQEAQSQNQSINPGYPTNVGEPQMEDGTVAKPIEEMTTDKIFNYGRVISDMGIFTLPFAKLPKEPKEYDR
jgi:hypothetical protein